MRRLIPALAVTLFSGCWVAEYDQVGDARFPLEPHRLWPLYTWNDGQIAAGKTTGPQAALEQPIPFSHNIHAGTLQMQCEYCHAEARRSIHAGVPTLGTCMNCHSQVKLDNPDVQKIHMAWCGEPKCTLAKDAYGQLVPPPNAASPAWQRVHDLPDYVYFAHKRHVQAGVQCTECHGQMSLQGQKLADPANPDAEPSVQVVNVRETTLQMGWCLDCHASHPTIDQNYGEQADLRRAELKDCWTCHK